MDGAVGHIERIEAVVNGRVLRGCLGQCAVALRVGKECAIQGQVGESIVNMPHDQGARRRLKLPGDDGNIVYIIPGEHDGRIA